MKLSKKGISLPSEYSAGLILAAVAAFMLLVLLIIFLTSSKSLGQETACRNSVEIRGKLTMDILGIKEEKLTPIACTTVELDKFDGTREEVKKQIADYSASCWRQFAEGSVPDLFSSSGGDKQCFVCYYFSTPKEMDKGVPPKLKFMDEPEIRDVNVISSGEMTNFFTAEVYNPGVLRGGGTDNYIGNIYDYGLDFGLGDTGTKVRVGSIDSTLLSGYLMDNSYMISPEARAEIDKMGAELQERDMANMLVIVADEFSSIDKSDARQIMERAGLNSNKTNYDGLLIMLDLKNHKIRVQAGIDLSIYIKDYDISKIMEENFKDVGKDCQDKDCKAKAVSAALQNTVQAIHDKLVVNKEILPGISPRSYYYYLSNAGETWTSVEDIKGGQTYAIVYVSTSDISLLRGFFTPSRWGTTQYSKEGLAIVSTNTIGSACTTVK
jgi:hypothetical protein